VLGYVKLAVNEGGEIACGEGKEPPVELPSPHTEVGRFSYIHRQACGLHSFVFSVETFCSVNFSDQ